jgi:hypothetical protein
MHQAALKNLIDDVSLSFAPVPDHADGCDGTGWNAN